MTEGLATEIAKEKMRDLGFKRKHYLLRYRNLRIDAGQKITLKGENTFFIVISVPSGVTITSKGGVFDLLDQTITELQHEHRGLTWINNTTTHQVDIVLLQVIPKIKK